MSMEGATGAYHDPGVEAASPKALYEPEAIARAQGILWAWSQAGGEGGTLDAERVFTAIEQAEQGESQDALTLGSAAGRAREGDAVIFVSEEEPELESAVDAPVVFGKGVVSTLNSRNSRSERTRDSIGTPEARHEAKLAAYDAARAERRKLKRQGKPRHWPAHDGYLPGNTPPKPDRWTKTLAHTVLLSELGVVVGDDTDRAKTSPAVSRPQRLASLHHRVTQEVLAAREAEVQERVRELTAEVFDIHEEQTVPADEAARLAAAEIAAFNEQRDAELAAEKPSADVEFPFCNPESAREYMVWAGLIKGAKGAKAKLQQLGHPSPQPRLATEQAN